MPAAAPQPPAMDADTFLEWCMHQEERYELVGGRPVLKDEGYELVDGRPVLMTGASRRHDLMVVNLLVALRGRLRGGPCHPSTADVASWMTRGNVRRPDVTVDCGAFEPSSRTSAEPTVFFEVLSPSTRSLDFLRKADEYRLLPSLKAFVMLEQDVVAVSLWTRGDDGGWGERELLTSLDEVLTMSAIEVEFPLAEIYDGVPLDG